MHENGIIEVYLGGFLIMSLVEERYEKWVNHPNLDQRYKAELENMSDQEKMMHSIPQLNLEQQVCVAY